MHWFTADLHLGHAAVIDICGRPFADLAAMEAHLLRAIQDRVAPDHNIWILGDFAHAKDIGDARDRIRDQFAAIPGRKHLIIGNHDRRWVRELPWTSVAHFHEIVVDQRRISLSHYPMVTFPGAGHGALQLFGHVHQNWAGSRNSINVGVDQWHYRPASLPEIEARAARLPVNRHWNQVEPGSPFPTVRCEGCSRVLDPALTSGHAVVRSGRIVIRDTGETIVIIGEALSRWLREGHHICPECIGGCLSIGEVMLPAGWIFNESQNRAVAEKE